MVTLWKINAKQSKLSNTMCPAVIATKRRTVSENGFVKIPINSTGKMTNAQRQRNTWSPEDMRPVCFIPFHIRNNKCQHSQVPMSPQCCPSNFLHPARSPRRFPNRIKKNKCQHVRQETSRNDVRYLVLQFHPEQKQLSARRKIGFRLGLFLCSF